MVLGYSVPLFSMCLGRFLPMKVSHKLYAFLRNTSVYLVYIQLIVITVSHQATSMQCLQLSESLKKSQLWNGTVSITLLEGINLPDGSACDSFVRFRLGDQKYRSKVYFIAHIP